MRTQIPPRGANRVRDWAVCASLAWALLSGCSTGSPVLARVGSRTITVSEFEEVAQRATSVYTVPADSAKRLLLEDMIKRALMLEAAKRQPFAQESNLRDYRQNVEREILSAAMVDQLVPRNIPVSEGEARELYRRRGYETHLQVIYTFDPRSAQAALAELRRGADFGIVADRFNPSGLLPSSGDLGFVSSGTLPTPLDAYLVEGEPGKILGPVQGPDEAWYLARVIARRPRLQEPFEMQQLTLMETLRQRKRRTLSVRAFNHLREAYGLHLEPGGAELLFARFNAPTGQEPPPETDDPTRVLARYQTETGRDTAFKLRDALADLQGGEGERPNPSMLASIEQWIQSRVMQRIVVMEARRRHLDEDPANAERIQERMDSYVLQNIYDAEVSQRAQPTDMDVRAAYERRAPTLAKLESASVQYLTLPDSTAAARLVERARQAPALKDAIVLSSPNLQVREEVVSFPSPDPTWSALEPALSGAPEGAYAGPFRVPDGWRVVQIRAARRAIPAFENLPAEVQQAIHFDAENQVRERRLTEYTDSLRRAMPLTVDLSRLERVPWPGPASGSPG